MTKNELRNIIIQEMKDCFSEQRKLKEGKYTIKRSELKGLIKEVVRLCIKEGGSQYTVQGKHSQYERPGLINRSREIQYDPSVNEENWIQNAVDPSHKGYCTPMSKPTCTPARKAFAQRAKHHELGEEEMQSQGFEVPSPDDEMTPPEEPTTTEHPPQENEQEEIRLIKQIGETLLQLLQMHRGMEEPESGEESEIEGKPFASDEPEASENPFAGGKSEKEEPKEKKKEPKEKKEKKPPVKEGSFRTSQRAYKTIKDVPQDPNNVRDSSIPQV